MILLVEVIGKRIYPNNRKPLINDGYLYKNYKNTLC